MIILDTLLVGGLTGHGRGARCSARAGSERHRDRRDSRQPGHAARSARDALEPQRVGAELEAIAAVRAAFPGRPIWLVPELS